MKKMRIRNEDRARIVLSRERDIERKLDEKEKINLQLEEYMKQYAKITGEKKVADDLYRGRKTNKVPWKLILITAAVIVVLVGGLVAYKLLA